MMNKVAEATDIEKTKSLIRSLDELLANRDDYQTNTGLQDIHDVLVQVDKTIEKNKYPYRLVSKLVSYIYSMGPAHKIFFPKEQESLINQLGTIAQKSGNTGLYYASYDMKSEFFKEI